MMTDPRFPILTQKQINTLKPYGDIINFERETLLFQVGDRDYDFYIVLEGEIAMKDNHDKDKVLVTHEINEFTGDNSMLSSRRIPFSAHASPGTSVLRIKPRVLKEIISKHNGIGEVLLSAFLLRQEVMLKEFVGGIKLIGFVRS